MSNRHPAGNDNSCLPFDVICSICGSLTRRHAPGVEPICIACLLNEDLRCGTCGARARGSCGQCGELVCSGCILLHEHPAGEAPQ